MVSLLLKLRDWFHKSERVSPQQSAEVETLSLTDPSAIWISTEPPAQQLSPHANRYLCAQCQRLDLRSALQYLSNPPKDSTRIDTAEWRNYREKVAAMSNHHVFFGLTKDINLRKATCSLCRLVCSIIECCTPSLRYLRSDMRIYLTATVDIYTPIILVGVGDQAFLSPKPTHGFRTSLCFYLPRPRTFGRFDPGVTSVQWQLHFGQTCHQVIWTKVAKELRECLSHHGEDCERTIGQILPTPTGILLIDVEQNRIVKADTNMKYIALSYVWGKHLEDFDILQLTTTNISALMGNDVQDSTPPLTRVWNRIPLVIQHAMEVVRAVGRLSGIYHLWVDALCIIQDDSSHKHHQIRQMDTIYGQAVMTIAALSTHSSHDSLLRHDCLTNDNDDSYPRLLESIQSIEYAKRIRVSIAGIPRASDQIYHFNQTMYSTRAWTFQEQLLSKRVLYISDRRMLFQCRKPNYTRDGRDLGGGWGNGLWHGNTDPSWEFRLHPRIFYQDTSIERYRRLVENYTSRYFSFRSDVLRAFAGIMEALKPGLDFCAPINHFICGLPCENIAYNLLWIRQGKEVKMEPKKSDLVFPSWSWANCAWNAQIIFPDNVTGLSDVKEFPYNRGGAATFHGITHSRPEISALVSPSPKIDQVADDISLLLWEASSSWPTLELDGFYVLHLRASIVPWPNSLRVQPQSLLKPNASTIWGSEVHHNHICLGHLDITPTDFLHKEVTQLSIIHLYTTPTSTAILVARQRGLNFERVAVGVLYREFDAKQEWFPRDHDRQYIGLI